MFAAGLLTALEVHIDTTLQHKIAIMNGGLAIELAERGSQQLANRVAKLQQEDTSELLDDPTFASTLVPADFGIGGYGSEPCSIDASEQVRCPWHRVRDIA